MKTMVNRKIITMSLNLKFLNIAVSSLVLGASFQTFAAGPDGDANDRGAEIAAPAAVANDLAQAMRQAAQPKMPALRTARKSMGIHIRVPVMNQPTRPPVAQGTEEERKLRQEN